MDAALRSPAAATSRTVAAGGLELHYLDYGSAGRPPLLCVHGGAAHAHWYDYFAGEFTRDFHVRALDQRGHGDSPWAEPPDYTTPRMAADLHEVAEALDLRDYVMVAHSMGGQIALNYAVRHPGRLARLVVVDSTLRLSPERLALMHARGARQSSYGTLDELVARYKLMPAGSTAPPEVAQHLARHAGRPSADGRWRHKFDRNVYAQRGSIDLVGLLARLTVPTLLVKAAINPRITPEIVAEVKATAPQVDVVEVAGAGHHVMLDEPAVLAREIRAFLARHA